MYIFSVNDEAIPYEVNAKNGLKYLRVTIDKGGMRVSLPHGMNLDDVNSFLNKKSKWIYTHYKRLQSAASAEGETRWHNGEKIMFRGRKCSIRLHGFDEAEVKICFNGDIFDIYAQKGLTEEERSIAVTEAFRRLYMMQSREIINERLIYYSKLMGVRYNMVRIKEQKTRWGSCSSKGNLNFNWRLVMAPPWVIDYVIIHELCHLKHMNHSKEFWHEVEGYMPEYHDGRKWLKDNGMKLMSQI